MLKLIFWVLVLANAGFAAVQFGFLDGVLSNGHEPVRIAQQLHPERLRQLPASVVEAGAAAVLAAETVKEDRAEPAVAPVPSATPPAPASPTIAAAPVVPEATIPPAAKVAQASALSCVELGNFTPEEADRFVDSIGALGKRGVRIAVREVLSYMVYMPPQGSREAAERKAQELRNLGINDFFIIQDNSAFRWGISLGVFKTEESARVHLVRLGQQGVRTARIGNRSVSSHALVLKFHAIDAASKKILEQTIPNFEKVRLNSCPAN